MNACLIRGRYVIVDADAPVLEHAALLVDEGRITAIGPYATLRVQAPGLPVIGSERHLVLPGFVNAHFHGKGLGSFQLGFLDDQLELWILERKAQRPVDAYLDTLLSTANLIESGVTSVLHSHVMRDPTRYENELERVLGAYQEAGLRVAFAPDIRWRNNFVYESDDRFAALLPQPLRACFERHIGTLAPVVPDRYYSAFDGLVARVGLAGPRHRLLYGPLSLQWTGDAEMREIARRAADYGTGLHIHVQESPYQFDLGPRTYGHSIVRQLDKLGALTPKTTLAHAVWLTDNDLDLLAQRGASYAHNLSANLRLKSGISPVLRAREKGVNVAIGTDSMTINDDEDYVQEMRLVAKMHRPPGIDEPALSSRDVLRMATRNGRKAVLFDDVGVLGAGGPADVVTMRLDRMLDQLHAPGFDPVDLLLYRGKREDIDHVLVAGECLLAGGRLTKIDKARTLDALREEAARYAVAPPPDTRRLMDELRPHLVRYYATWFREHGEPHYVFNSRV